MYTAIVNKGIIIYVSEILKIKKINPIRKVETPKTV